MMAERPDENEEPMRPADDEPAADDNPGQKDDRPPNDDGDEA
jgi:hypothetical protein